MKPVGSVGFVVALVLAAAPVIPSVASRFGPTSLQQPSNHAPRWACVPWGASNVQDQDWPLLVDAFRTDYPAYEGQVVVHLNGDGHAWRRWQIFNEKDWSYSAVVVGGEHVPVQCTTVIASIGKPPEIQIILKCPLPSNVTTFNFTVHTNDPALGSHTYPNVTLCPPPLPTSHRLVMSTWVRPNRIDRFWLVPFVKVHQALGVEMVLVYVITDFGDPEQKHTWEETFSRKRMQKVLDQFSDLENIVFVPFTVATNSLTGHDMDNTLYNQLGMVAHSVYTQKGSTRWLGLCDIDEYFWPAGNNTSLLQVVAKYDDSEHAALAAVWESYAGTNWTPEKDNAHEIRQNMNMTGTVLDCINKGRMTVQEKWPPGNKWWYPAEPYKLIVHPEKTKMPKIHNLHHYQRYEVLDQHTEIAIHHYQHQCGCFLPPCDLVDTSSRDFALALGITPCTIDPKHPACKPTKALWGRMNRKG